MLVVLYVESLLLGLLSLGFIKLISIMLTTIHGDAGYVYTFTFLGTVGLVSLWWVLIAALLTVHKQRLYKLPKIIWAGVGTGFFFAAFMVFYPWLFMSPAHSVNDFPAPLLFFLSLPCGIAIHVLRVVTKTRFIPPFKAEMFGVK
ncbi:hypothetical protein DFR42_12721 [Undibacterium pigrum]|uniref:Uncharacterized protein n=2 Tax=Undibacterium pigrum TaxID=401470 RepID=A0A318IK79_9BURK|nr:hypothetical protein DFR42_12721 [Undibacterium pigrum]